MYKIDKQQGYIVQHRELQLLFCNNFKWSIIYKNTESLCCPPETDIIFQVNYTLKKQQTNHNHHLEMQHLLGVRITGQPQFKREYRTFSSSQTENTFLSLPLPRPLPWLKSSPLLPWTIAITSELVPLPQLAPLKSTLHTVARMSFPKGKSDIIALCKTLQWLPSDFRRSSKIRLQVLSDLAAIYLFSLLFCSLQCALYFLEIPDVRGFCTLRAACHLSPPPLHAPLPRHLPHSSPAFKTQFRLGAPGSLP